MGTVMWDYIGTTIESIPPFPPKNQTDKETEDRRPGQLTPSSAERRGRGASETVWAPAGGFGAWEKKFTIWLSISIISIISI